MKSRAVLFLLLLISTLTGAQTDPVHAWVSSHQRQVVRQFADLLALPNNASDTDNIRKNAEYIAAQLSQRGVQARLLEESGGPPIVYGELKVSGATRTVMIYAHYDGQPVAAADWATPPWKPTVRDAQLERGGKVIGLDDLPSQVPANWWIYARSAGDDKLPEQAILSALDALKAEGLRPTVNLKFFFEGEEEAGSPHLESALARYSDLLKGDVWLFCDGPMHQTRRQQLYFGARGVVDLEMTIYGPSKPMHDGHYGNWAPNPAVLMAELISSMRDSNAQIKIAGFYDDVRPLTAREKEAISLMPDADTTMLRELHLAWHEGPDESLAMRITHPALNVRGIDSGHVGDKAQNAVPTEATASIDFRLVPDQQPERIKKLVEDHIRMHGFHIVHSKPTLEQRSETAKLIWLSWGPGYPAAKTDMDIPVAGALVRTLQVVKHDAIIEAPLLGGSIPMYLFLKQAPVIGLPLANHDDNQHAANENLRIQNLYDAIDVFGAVMTRLDAQWK